MPLPLTFAVEFATAQAERALSSLVSTVKASTVDIAANVLAPISPANLVTQIAQQGLGINALAGNLVSGGLGALSSSRYGYLSQMGAQFGAENAAINQTSDLAVQARRSGKQLSDEAMDFAYRLNYSFAMGDEQERMRVNERIARGVASHDISSSLINGTRLFLDVYGEVAGAKRWLSENVFHRASRETNPITKTFAAGTDILDWAFGR